MSIQTRLAALGRELALVDGRVADDVRKSAVDLSVVGHAAETESLDDAVETKLERELSR